MDEVHASYSLVSQLCDQVDGILSFFKPIRNVWFPKGQQLKENLLVIKNDPKAPQIMGTTWKNFNLLIKELPYVEEEKKALTEKIESFRGL